MMLAKKHETKIVLGMQIAPQELCGREEKIKYLWPAKPLQLPMIRPPRERKYPRRPLS